MATTTSTSTSTSVSAGGQSAAPHGGPNEVRPVAGIKPPQVLVLDANISSNWKMFYQKWRNYAIITYLSRQPREYQTALLLHTLEDEALQVYNGFSFTTPEEERTTDEIITAFEKYAVGEVNVTYERFVFHSRKQGEGESIDAFIASLRTLIKTCAFCEECVESILRDQVVLGIKDPDTQSQLLKERNLNLKTCIDICKLAENAIHHSKALRPENVNKVATKQPRKTKFGKQPAKHSSKQSPEKECMFCTTRHELKRDLCPAYGKTCSKCRGKNHFAAKCRASRERVRAVQDQMASDEGTDYEPVDTVFTTEASVNVVETKMIKAEMLVNNRPVTFQLDSGASVNLMNVARIQQEELSPSSKTLIMWNGAQVKPLGECRVKMVNPKTNARYAVKFVVVKEDLHPILGATAIQKMGLVTINEDQFKMVAAVSRQPDVIAEFSDVFKDELGSLPGTVHLNTDPNVTPHVAGSRRIPIAIKPKVKQELKNMVQQGIIEPVNEPTNWVSSLALVIKRNGKLRICIDPRPLNKALKREHFQLPILDDILPDLAGAKVFTTLDLKNGFWHLKLDEESSTLTTFSTPFGRYRWKVLPFGIAPAPEIFQKNVQANVADLDGVLNVADDLLVYGKGDTDEEAMADHDKKLKKLLQRCRERGIRLNPDKLKLRKNSLCFLGHEITRDGLRPDPEKVRAITEMPTPTDVAAIQRLGGFVNYLSKFLPKISDIMAPLRNLTKANVPWTWSVTHEAAFQKVKKTVSEAAILRFYDKDKPLMIQCDASEKGLGATLLQEGQPLAYISRALTDCETRYAQIEKELLAIVFSCERFHQYTYGQHVTVQSDHRPLEAIMKKDLASCPKRLQNMLMRLQKYDVTVVYHPGKKMHLADTLSRAFLVNSVDHDDEFDVDESKYLPIRENRLTELRRATKDDRSMQLLQQAILNGWPNEKIHLDPEIREYYAFKDEMTVQDGLILRGNRVIVPASQRKTLKERLHSSHIGTEGCCRRARECLYWPGMNADIREFVSRCATCRKFEIANPAEPLMPHEIPDRPWAKIGTDIFTWEGRDYLCTVDYMSNFWEVDFLPVKDSQTVVTKLKHHFARYGIPDQVVSDGASQFDCEYFAHFTRKWSFTHTMTSPYNSKGNGKVESAVKMVKNLFRKAREDNRDPYLAILDHRNTPSQGMLSPAQRLMSRRTKTLLPTTADLLRPQPPKELKHVTSQRQMAQKQQFNKRVKALKPLEVGDVVRVKPYVKTSREWKKATVLERLDTRSYNVNLQGAILRRNRVDLKKTTEPPPRPTVQVPRPRTPTNPQESTEPQNNATSVEIPAIAPNTPTPATQPTGIKPSIAVPTETSSTAVPSPTSAKVPTPIKKSRYGREIKTPSRFQEYTK